MLDISCKLFSPFCDLGVQNTTADFEVFLAKMIKEAAQLRARVFPRNFSRSTTCLKLNIIEMKKYLG